MEAKSTQDKVRRDVQSYYELVLLRDYEDLVTSGFDRIEALQELSSKYDISTKEIVLILDDARRVSIAHAVKSFVRVHGISRDELTEAMELVFNQQNKLNNTL